MSLNVVVNNGKNVIVRGIVHVFVDWCVESPTIVVVQLGDMQGTPEKMKMVLMNTVHSHI